MSLSKVKIDTVSLTENHYTDKYGNVYGVLKLIEHSRKYKQFDLPLCGVDLSILFWSINDVDSFIHHSKRVQSSDLKYPILLDHRGVICDGWHRVCKAILKGDTTIKAIRLETMPDRDRLEENS